MKIDVQSPFGPYSSSSIFAQPPRSAIVKSFGGIGMRLRRRRHARLDRPEAVVREDLLPFVRDAGTPGTPRPASRLPCDSTELSTMAAGLSISSVDGGITYGIGCALLVAEQAARSRR